MDPNPIIVEPPDQPRLMIFHEARIRPETATRIRQALEATPKAILFERGFTVCQLVEGRWSQVYPPEASKPVDSTRVRLALIKALVASVSIALFTLYLILAK